MNLSELSLKRPVLAIVLSLVIMLFGAIGYSFLGVREYPAIDPPTITVSTSYTGANPEIVETQITELLEKAINGIEGINNISSTSALGNSNITVEFNLGVSLEQAANDVRDKVSQAVNRLPQDIDAPPVVTKADANSDPIMFIPVQSTTRNIMQLSDFVENVLQERLQTVPGVSAVQVFGLKRSAMRLWIDPKKLVAYGVTIQDITQALNRENVELPGGKIRGNASELTVKAYGRLTNEEDFNNLIIKNEAGATVKFMDVGEAVLGPESEETGVRKNGVANVSMAVIAQPGANYVEIANEIYKRLEEFKKDLPTDIILEIGIDKSTFVRKATKEVGETLLIAIGLVVLIVYLFFRNWIVAIRPLIDIPVSLIGAFFIMYVSGFSVNVLTLLAIVLATGLVVDDGIVVTENIYKKLEEGMDKYTAAKEGSKEIFFAVISTSITLAIVFLPIIFLKGFVGSLFREFGVVVAGAVLISAFVSLTLTPVLNVYMSADPHSGWFYRKTEPFFRGMDQFYKKILGGFLKARWVSLIIVAACVLLIVLLNKTLPSELAPLEDRSLIRNPYTMPEGTDFDANERFASRLSQTLQDSVPESRMVFGVLARGGGAVNTGFFSILLTDPEDRKRSQMEITQQLSRIFKRLSDARVNAVQEQTINTGFGAATQQPVQFVIQNLNFEKLKEKLPLFLEEASKSEVLQGVDVNLKFNKPELTVTMDKLKANQLGVSVLDVSNTLQLALSGRRFGYFLMNGKQYQVIGQVDRGNRDDPSDIKGFFVRNRSGQMIQLDNLVTITETSSPPQIYHFNRFKSATISAGLSTGRTLGEAIKEMERIKKKLLDDTFQTSLSGASRDFAESASNTNFAFLLALVLIYLVLSAQFESFIDPLIIMITVPLALAGALLSLWAFDQTLNIFSQIGIIMLIGLVTKNGILIVEFANQKREQGMPKLQAVREAAVARLRPILMTTLATVLGALPIALALGSAGRSRIPLGIVIVGGLLFALVLTLFVVPAMYGLFSRRKKVQEKI
jgi:multidrug efflux pump